MDKLPASVGPLSIGLMFLRRDLVLSLHFWLSLKMSFF